MKEIWQRRWDDLVLGVLLFVIGGGRVILALATGETFGAQATLALIALVLGFLVFPWRRRPCST
jgi:hypothetical protein